MVKTVSPIFQELFQTTNDPVLIINTSCQIKSINDQAALLLNVDKHKTSFLEMDELSKTRWSSFMEKLQQEIGAKCTLNIKVDDENYRELSFIGFYSEKGKLIFVKIIPLHTHETHRMSTVIRDISHGVILSDNKGAIIDVNDIVINLLSVNKRQVIGNPLEKLFEKFHDFEFNKFQYYANLTNFGHASIRLTRCNDQGEEVYLTFNTKYNYSSNTFITTITDETEKINLKKQIEHQSPLSSIGQMAASIAHEIRNPMTSLKGFVELLKLNSTDNNQKYLDVMDSELHRMESILNELLYLSKPLERNYNEISIAQVIEDVIEIMQQHAIQHNIFIELEKNNVYLDNVIGNDNRLKQMFINLVKNAIEEMPNGGTITINMNRLKNDSIQIAIIDQGKGLAEDEVENLFVPFYTTKESGTGLGLALVKKVIEEHKGTISVESMIGRGTTFIIDLPLLEEQHLFNKDEQLMNVWVKNNVINNLPVV